MTSEELAKLYAEVVAVRPEAAVDMCGVSLFWEGPEDEDGEEVDRPGWFIGDDGGEFRPCGGEVPAAMILSHWLGMLPDGMALHRHDQTVEGERYQCWTITKVPQAFEKPFQVVQSHSAPTELEALAAFLKENP